MESLWKQNNYIRFCKADFIYSYEKQNIILHSVMKNSLILHSRVRDNFLCLL